MTPFIGGVRGVLAGMVVWGVVTITVLLVVSAAGGCD
jgi:hypothetical protein